MVKILVVNPGSASTKIAIFEGEKLVLEKTFRHEIDIILSFPNSYTQKEFRKSFIIDFLKDAKYKLEDIDVFVGRGGLVRPLESGTYEITEAMIEDLKTMKYGDHVCNLGCIIAYEFAQALNKPAYTVDPVVVDELDAIARVSGYEGMERVSIFHALNQKAVAKRYAKEINKPYETLNLIVAHLGGGISVGLHKKGRIVDVNNAFGGEGPFTPERAGTLPLFSVIERAFETGYTLPELKKHLVTRGGLYSYLGTSSGMEITKRIDLGDEKARFYLHAMCYRIIKEIGGLCFISQCEIDALIITGGLAYNPHVMAYLQTHLPKHLNYVVYAGEDELLALAQGALRVINKEEPLKHY